MDRILRLWICSIVTLGWLFNLMAPAFSDYESNLVANGPMLLVIGALFPRRAPAADEEAEPEERKPDAREDEKK